MDDEAVALEFAADVEEAVASVRELATSAQDLAATAKEAQDGVAGIAAPAQEAAAGTDELAAATDTAAESMGIYYDAAGRARLANGQFASSAELAAAGLKETSAAAEAAAGAQGAAASAISDAAAAQARFAETQKAQADAAAQLAELQKGGAASTEELTAATNALTDASVRAAAARKDLATMTATASDEQVAAGIKTDGAAASLGKYKMALVGIGIGTAVAVDAAGKFQDQTTHLVTDAGEAANQLGMVQQGILKISAATATSASEITDGMYHVESAGAHGAQGLAELQTAAEGAKVGGADLNDVAFALVGSMNAYYGSTMTAAQATSRSTAMMNELIAVTGAGDLKMQDLSTSLHSMSPVAAAAHVSLAQIGGALATMTAQGMSAQQGAQDIGHTLGQLVNPAKTATKEMALMGVSARDVAEHLGQRGLTGTLAMLSQAAKEHAGAAGQTYAAAMSKMLNGTVGLNTSLMLTGSHLSDFQKNVDTVQAAADKGGTSVDNWSMIQSTFNFKLEQAKTATEDAGIALGSALLPAVTAVLGPLASMLAFIAGNKAASIAFAVVIGGVLAGALGLKLAGALKDAKEGIQAVGEGAEWLVGKLRGTQAATEAQAAASEAASATEAASTEEAAGALGQYAWMARSAAVASGELAEAQGAQAEATDAVAVATAEADVAEAANPIGLIIIAVVALIAIIVLLVTHWKTVWHDVCAVVDDAVNWIKSHWALILDILLGPVGLVITQLVQHWNTIRSDATKVIADVVDWIKQHWALLTEIFGGPVAAVVTFLVTHWNQIASDVSKFISNVLSFFEKLPGQITGFLSKLPGDMLSIGKNIVNGLINGIESQGSVLANAILSLIPSPIRSLVEGALGIASPSTVFHGYGVNIVQGLINGVKSRQSDLKGAIQDMADGAAGTGSALAVSAVAPAGGSSTSVHVTAPLTVQAGSGYDTPQFQAYLQAAMQEATLRYGQLNPNNGLTTAWGRG